MSGNGVPFRTGRIYGRANVPFMKEELEMKKNTIMGIVWIAVATILTLLLIQGLTGGFPRMGQLPSLTAPAGDEWEGGSSGQGSLTKENSFSADDIRQLEAELKTLPLNIEASKDGMIHVDFLDGAENWCRLSSRGSRLSVEGKKTPTGPSGRVCVSLPASWRGKLDLECVSGAVQINGIQADTLDVETVSGAVNISDCSAATLDAESVSGSVHATGAFGKAAVETVSGSIQVGFTAPPKEKCRFESVSGAVSLSLPHDSGYTLKYKSMSGSFSDEISGTSGGRKGMSSNGDGAVPISVSTMSGAIRVQ